MSKENNKVVSGFSISNYISEESHGGIILILATLIAIIWANSRYYEFYHYLWHELQLGFSIGNFELKNSLHYWINDGLMAVFFFTIGLEIKREVLAGELSTLRKASLPVMAALGGMIVPAGIYALINLHHPGSIKGWGIPMATDIAFALGLLSLLGKRVPVSLKIFLTALAIADDLGAILVIAIFYTDAIQTTELIYAAIFLIILIIGNRIGIRRTGFYAVIGLLGVWLSFIYSGVHATIAGVLIALTIPVKTKISEEKYISKLSKLLDNFRKERPNESSLLTQNQAHLISEIEQLSDTAHTPLQKLEHNLHPVSAYFILPLFALANAGVHIEGEFWSLFIHPTALGIIFGLVLGKFIGISVFSKLMTKLNLAELPDGMSWRQLYGLGFLAGIGFTMSIFISDLAFSDDQYIQIAKVGIFAASFLSAVAGILILARKPGEAIK